MSPQFYRREAFRYRLMAGQEPDHERALKFRRMAAEYDDLADDMEPLSAMGTKTVAG